MKTLDLNCDMGESFGAWRMGDDAAVLEHVSSVNLACGFHAGDPTTIRSTMAAALARGVAVGAHPSLPDLAGVPEFAPEMLGKSERRKREKAERLAKRRSKAGPTQVATTKVDEPERAYPVPEPPGRRSLFAGIFSNDPSDGPVFSPNAGGGYAAVKYEARAQNVSEKLALSIARIESNGACGAQSSAKAIGVMQIKHTTAQMMGYTGSAKGLKNCKTSAKYGVKYLAWCLELADGDVKKAALCYNQGHGTLLNKKKYGKRIYRTEAKGYIAKLKAQGWRL